MQLRIANEENSPLLVILEPWATEYIIAPNDYIQLKAQGNTPADAYFLLEHRESTVIVTPEWEKALIHAYTSKGDLID
jgi:hypothetical protein